MDKKIQLLIYTIVFIFTSSCRNVKRLELPNIYHGGHPKKCESCSEIH